jgi:cell pole-organizing protein PopZ
MSDTEQEPSMEEILASIRRIISDDDKEMEAATEQNEGASEVKDELVEEEVGAMPEPEPESEPEPEPAPELSAEEIDDDDDDDILDLTDMEAPDPEPLFEEQAYKEVEPEPVAPPVSPSPPPPSAPTPPAANLVSPPQAGEASGSFERLTEKLNEDYSELPIGNGAVTLEGLTRELVRPMLKEWLDQHLPMTVERLVREEIERLVMQSQRRDPW